MSDDEKPAEDSSTEKGLKEKVKEQLKTAMIEFEQAEDERAKLRLRDPDREAEHEDLIEDIIQFASYTAAKVMRLGKPVWVDKSNIVSTAGVAVTPQGKLLYLWSRPFWDSLSPRQRQAVALHETIHVMYGHPWRLREYDRDDHQKWNWAFDAPINDFIDAAASWVELPEWVIRGEDLIGQNALDLSSTEVFELIPPQPSYIINLDYHLWDMTKEELEQLGIPMPSPGEGEDDDDKDGWDKFMKQYGQEIAEAIDEFAEEMGGAPGIEDDLDDDPPDKSAPPSDGPQPPGKTGPMGIPPPRNRKWRLSTGGKGTPQDRHVNRSAMALQFTNIIKEDNSAVTMNMVSRWAPKSRRLAGVDLGNARIPDYPLEETVRKVCLIVDVSGSITDSMLEKSWEGARRVWADPEIKQRFKLRMFAASTYLEEVDWRKFPETVPRGDYGGIHFRELLRQLEEEFYKGESFPDRVVVSTDGGDSEIGRQREGRLDLDVPHPERWVVLLNEKGAERGTPQKVKVLFTDWQ